MLTVIVLFVGAVIVWLIADHVLSARRQRRRSGPFGPGRVFHSTGFEDTLPPAEAAPSLSLRQRA